MAKMVVVVDVLVAVVDDTLIELLVLELVDELVLLLVELEVDEVLVTLGVVVPVVPPQSER
jgi:hypothetical protein